MLNSFDGRALRTYDQTHYSVGHSYLNRYVTRHRRRWPRWCAYESAQRALARRTNLREVFRGGKNLTLRTSHVFLATSDDEDGFFTTHRRLDVGVRLRSKSFDLAACNQKKKKTFVISYRYFPFFHSKRFIELSHVLYSYPFTLSTFKYD